MLKYIQTITILLLLAITTTSCGKEADKNNPQKDKGLDEKEQALIDQLKPLWKDEVATEEEELTRLESIIPQNETQVYLGFANTKVVY